jgi:hypothetical protein
MPLEMVVHTLDSLDFNVERKELYADREIESVRERERQRFRRIGQTNRRRAGNRRDTMVPVMGLDRGGDWRKR